MVTKQLFKPSIYIFIFSVPITTLAMGPLNIYTNISNDPCYMIENMLFDVESRLKRCEPETRGNNSFLTFKLDFKFRIP